MKDKDKTKKQLIDELETLRQRTRMEEELQKAHDKLERRVEERTAELLATNRKLKKEVEERRRIVKELRESEEKYRAIFESFHDVYYRTDKNGRIAVISPSVQTHAGYNSKEVIGHPVTDFYLYPSDREIFLKKLKKSKVMNDYELKLKAKDGRVIDTSVSSKIIFGKDGVPIGVEGVLRDITERKKAEEQIKESLKEKEVLLKEIHHRVKNNMQVISSLLNLQSKHIKDKEASKIFRGSQNRVKSMALIHERLYQSKDLSRINFAHYARNLASYLFHSYGISSKTIKFQANIKNVFLDINTAIPCGLIINELVSNSLKHAFPDGKKGEIKIAMHPLNENKVELIVSDNGIGMPKEVDIKNTESLGLHLVTILAEEQLHGHIKLDRTKGTSFQIRLGMKQ